VPDYRLPVNLEAEYNQCSKFLLIEILDLIDQHGYGNASFLCGPTTRDMIW
jgi:hypothetical protein